mgnify:CR=1 FL=1
MKGGDIIAVIIIFYVIIIFKLCMMESDIEKRLDRIEAIQDSIRTEQVLTNKYLYN